MRINTVIILVALSKSVICVDLPPKDTKNNNSSVGAENAASKSKNLKSNKNDAKSLTEETVSTVAPEEQATNNEQPAKPEESKVEETNEQPAPPAEQQAIPLPPPLPQANNGRAPAVFPTPEPKDTNNLNPVKGKFRSHVEELLEKMKDKKFDPANGEVGTEGATLKSENLGSQNPPINPVNDGGDKAVEEQTTETQTDDVKADTKSEEQQTETTNNAELPGGSFPVEEPEIIPTVQQQTENPVTEAAPAEQETEPAAEPQVQANEAEAPIRVKDNIKLFEEGVKEQESSESPKKPETGFSIKKLAKDTINKISSIFGGGKEKKENPVPKTRTKVAEKSLNPAEEAAEEAKSQPPTNPELTEPAGDPILPGEAGYEEQAPAENPALGKELVPVNQGNGCYSDPFFQSLLPTYADFEQVIINDQVVINPYPFLKLARAVVDERQCLPFAKQCISEEQEDAFKSSLLRALDDIYKSLNEYTKLAKYNAFSFMSVVDKLGSNMNYLTIVVGGKQYNINRVSINSDELIMNEINKITSGFAYASSAVHALKLLVNEGMNVNDLSNPFLEVLRTLGLEQFCANGQFLTKGEAVTRVRRYLNTQLTELEVYSAETGYHFKVKKFFRAITDKLFNVKRSKRGNTRGGSQNSTDGGYPEEETDTEEDDSNDLNKSGSEYSSVNGDEEEEGKSGSALIHVNTVFFSLVSLVIFVLNV